MADEQMSFDDVEVVEEKQELTEITNSELATGQNMFGNMKDFKNAYVIAQNLANSTLIPQAFQKKPMDCLIAIDMSNRMNVSPMFVLQNLSVIRGVPSWSGQACISLINACGRFKNVKPVYTGEVGKESRACHFEAIDIKSGETVVGTTIDWNMIKAEGWDKNSKWKTMTDQMLAYRAASFFARVYCPMALMGCRVEGEVEDISANKEVTKAIDISEG